MPYSYAVYTGNGTNDQFTVSFPYIRKEHVFASVNYANATFTWVNNSTIKLDSVPANAARVEVRRVTPVTAPLVDFADGSTLVAADLDTNALQQTYINQEQDDQIRLGIYVDANGNLTAAGQRIQNVADPTGAQDAATKNYVDTTTVASAGDIMTGNLAMGGNKVTGLGTPTASGDAATKTYVDTNDALKVSKAGDSMTGPLAMGTNKITGLGDPTNAQDAVTKSWVETAGASPLVQFRSIFYGAYATDPAVDPYGAARTEGDLYFNTTLDQMRVFNGTSWQEASADATITRFKFTAAGGETSLSGNDDNAQSLTYNVGLEMVYLNGALLTRGVDYVATTGSSITGLVALAAADLVEVVAFSQIDAIGSIPSANSTFLQSGTGAVQRTVESKLKEGISVKDFGAVGDGVADDTTEIQAAINAAAAQGGGKVLVPPGRYKISSSLDITTTGIVLQGAGGDGSHDAGTTVDAPTKLVWAGGSNETVVKVRTPANLATGSKIYGSGVADLEIECASVAGIGVFVESVNKCVLIRVHVNEPTIAAYKITCLQTGVSLPEAADTQAGTFQELSWRCLAAPSRNAHGIWTTAYGLPSPNANVSGNVFINCGGQNWGQTGSTGIPYFIEEGDNNLFLRCGGFRVYGDLPGLEIRGNGVNDAHHFINCSLGLIRIKGTASGYASDPVRCSFYAMDNFNGTQYPTLDAGCRVTYHSDSGVWEKPRIQKLLATEFVADANTQTIGAETLRIHNINGAGFVNCNNTTSWQTSIDSSTQDLRVLRTVGGSGLVRFQADARVDGSLGIGTSTPGTKLDVFQGAGVSGVQVSSIEKTSSTTGGVAGGEFIGSRGDGNESFFGRLGLGFRRNDGTAIQSGVRVGGLVFGGQHGTGTTYDAASTRYAASVVGVSEGIYTNDTTMATAIAFRTGSTGNDIRAVNSAYGTERARFNKDGQLLIGTTTAGASKLVVNDNSIQINTAKTPASATDTGTTGQIAWDANYIYVCTATNTWKRSAIATW